MKIQRRWTDGGRTVDGRWTDGGRTVDGRPEEKSGIYENMKIRIFIFS